MWLFALALLRHATNPFSRLARDIFPLRGFDVVGLIRSLK